MKEQEIRPYSIFDEYLRLSNEDIKYYFCDAELIYSNCPSCDMPGEKAFVKSNFNYEIFNYNEVNNKLNDHMNYKNDNSDLLWCLAMFKIWEEQNI